MHYDKLTFSKFDTSLKVENSSHITLIECLKNVV